MTERAGWFTTHPLTEKPVHVVTREWFEELRDAAAVYFREFDHLINEDYPERTALRDALRLAKGGRVAFSPPKGGERP